MSNKILVVEADASARTELLAVLSGAGYAPRGVPDAPSAFKALAEDDPDLLIANIRLDGYNGLQLVAMGPKPIRAIVMTEHPDPTLAVDAKRLGAEYVIKPVSNEQLLDLVERRLRTLGTEEIFVPARQWPRKDVPTDVTLRVHDLEARIVDVSHGGARLDVALGEQTELPLTVAIELPGTSEPLEADVMWQRQIEPGRRLCGVAIDPIDSPSWVTFVDEVP